MNHQVWQTAAFFIFVFFNLVAIPALILRRNDFADVAWGPGFIVGILGGLWVFPDALSFSETSSVDWRFIVPASMVTIWALRLAWHVGLRNLSHPTEDARYNKWRKEWGTTWLWRSYLQVFVLQAIILFIIDLSLIWVLASPKQEWDLWCVLGGLMWVIGFYFESVSDQQLKTFKDDPANKGKLIQHGLWAWSRHPNYFGEVLQWWGIFCFAITLPYGWITVVSPLMISFLILKVSGVPMLEEQMKNRPGFAEYAARTPRFFPRPPKSE